MKVTKLLPLVVAAASIAFPASSHAASLIVTGSYNVAASVELAIMLPVQANYGQSGSSQQFQLADTNYSTSASQREYLSHSLSAGGRAAVHANASLVATQRRSAGSTNVGGSVSFSGSGYSGSGYQVWAAGSTSFDASGHVSIANPGQIAHELNVVYAFSGGFGYVRTSIGESDPTASQGTSGRLSGVTSSDSFVDIRFPGNGSLGGVPNPAWNKAGSGSVIWGVNALPGSSRSTSLPATNPFVVNPRTDIDDNVNEDDLAIEPTMVNGSYLVSPVAPGYGLNSTVFFNAALGQEGPAAPPETAMPMTSEESLATHLVGDALFTSYGPNFASITLPLAVPELGFYTIQSEDLTVQLQAGEVFDFTTWNSEGVSSFVLLGYGGQFVTFDDDALSQYATGFTFASEGLAEFSYQLLPVPEPSSVVIMAAASLTLCTLGYRNRKKNIRPTAGQ